MATHLYYAIRPDETALPDPDDGLWADGRWQQGVVGCFASLADLVESRSLLMTCVGFVDERRSRVVSFEADATETTNPGDREELVARPQHVRTSTPLREFLQHVASTEPGALGSRAVALLERTVVSLDSPESFGRTDPEAEFTRGPHEPEPRTIEVFVVARPEAELLARPPGPFVDGRELPRGYRSAFYSRRKVLLSQALLTAAGLDDPEDPQHVVTVEVESDMLCVPEAYDQEEPERIFVRPLAVVESTPVAEWVAAYEAPEDDDEEVARLRQLHASLRNAAGTWARRRAKR